MELKIKIQYRRQLIGMLKKKNQNLNLHDYVEYLEIHTHTIH